MENKDSTYRTKRTLLLAIIALLLLQAVIPATVHFKVQHQSWLPIPVARASDINEEIDRPNDRAGTDTELLQLEAEDGRGDGQVMARSKASGELTVLLGSGESWNLPFSSPSPCDITYGVTIRYSNDHDESQPLETVMVGVDGEPVGQFEAENTKPPGQPPGSGWNEFKTSDQIGTVVLQPGDHEITISVSDGDGFGVEIDVVYLENIEQSCDLFLPLVTRTIPPVDLEGENGSCDGPVMERSNASGGFTALLVGGESCKWIAESGASQYTVEVRYSNDHDESKPLETVTVAIDGETVGQFQAANTRLPGQDPGTGWNEFRSSGLNGTVMLETGSHEIVVSITDGDDFGVEIDVVVLNPVSSLVLQR